MNDRFSPVHVGKVAPKPKGLIHTAFLEPVRIQTCYEGQDEMAEWAQTYRPARPADPDDVFSQDEDYDDAVRVRELLAQSPVPTPNGKYVGIAMDACAALYEVVIACRRPPMDHVFSEVDVDKWAAICRRAGYQF